MQAKLEIKIPKKRTGIRKYGADSFSAFFCMAYRLRGNGRYIKKENVIGGPDGLLRPV